MDLSLIASAAVSFVTPYLAKGGEEMAAEIGKDIWTLMKKPFTSDKDKALIKQLQENPDDKKAQGKVELKLEELLEIHAEIAEQLNLLLSQIDQGERFSSKSMIVTGNKNTAIQDVNGSTINISR